MERSPQGGCITKPFTENKKPEDPTKCTVIAGFSSARLSDSPYERGDKPGSGSPGQKRSYAPPETPPEHTGGCSDPTCSSPSLEEGGRWQEAAGGTPAWLGCRTSGGCRAQPTGTAPLPALGGRRGRRASRGGQARGLPASLPAAPLPCLTGRGFEAALPRAQERC